MKHLGGININHKSEHAIQNDIQVAVSADNCYIERVNVGKVKTADGGVFNAGPKPGRPDLSGFKHNNGKAFYIEVKDYRGRPRPDQIKFHEMLTKYGVIHGIARSPEDALKIIDNELVGYGF